MVYAEHVAEVRRRIKSAVCPARATGCRTPPATCPFCILVLASRAPVPLDHHAHIWRVWHGRAVLLRWISRRGVGVCPPKSTHNVCDPSKPTRFQTRSTHSPSSLARSRCAVQRGRHIHSHPAATTPYFLKYSAWIISATAPSSCLSRFHDSPLRIQKNISVSDHTLCTRISVIILSATAVRCPLSSPSSDSAFLTASNAPSLLRSSSLGLPDSAIFSLICRTAPFPSSRGLALTCAGTSTCTRASQACYACGTPCTLYTRGSWCRLRDLCAGVHPKRPAVVIHDMDTCRRHHFSTSAILRWNT